MTFSLFEASAPPMARQLRALSELLRKGETFCTDRGVEPEVLLSARLAPDMFPLTRQVQIASDGAKGGVARLAGIEVPSWPDEEKTFSELQDRITRTLDFIEGAPREAIEAGADRAISLKLRAGELHFQGRDFLMSFVLPNFYFHVTTAYAILRHNGVELTKRDFLGG